MNGYPIYSADGRSLTKNLTFNHRRWDALHGYVFTEDQLLDVKSFFRNSEDKPFYMQRAHYDKDVVVQGDILPFWGEEDLSELDSFTTELFFLLRKHGVSFSSNFEWTDDETYGLVGHSLSSKSFTIKIEDLVSEMERLKWGIT